DENGQRAQRVSLLHLQGFADSAFASFSRRRSTQREDIDGEYVTGGAMADLTSEEGEEVFE
ncbi:MAG: hypothetical protein O7E56_13925, partial [SAR324 cluster bacterium]|nr:hypothetical protein [SAR324 cluster bacterium]